MPPSIHRATLLGDDAFSKTACVPRSFPSTPASPSRQRSRHASAAALLPQPRPVFEPLFDLALEAARGGIVEGAAANRLGPVVLARERVGRVVVVLIVRAVALAFHEPGRGVEDGFR